MTAKLFLRAVTKFISGVVSVGLLLFLSAGTLSFPNGWLFMGILFAPMLLAGVIMMIKNPALLEKRLHAKEKRKEQNIVVICSGLMFAAGFIVAGLGFRFGWYILPKGAAIGAAAVFLAAYLLYAEVLRENTYLSHAIEVQENQKVIDTGLYGIVRHPMYAAAILLSFSIPFVLGSLYAFPFFLIHPFLIILRIKNEEELLERELEGYAAYKQKVKYRLIPFIW
ncbi:MAG: methyltransferase family protein [Christensenellales bacterium]